MPPQASKASKAPKALPYIAGFFILLILVGLSLGLRTVIEFDPRGAQIRTTRYIFLHIPISSDTFPTWISQGPAQNPDWQLMHEFHHSAAGSKIHHTHWGAIADTLEPWRAFRFDAESKHRLAARTFELIQSDHPVKAIRIYLLRIDAMLKYELQTSDTPLTPERIDALFKEALIKPIDAEASKIPDP